MRYDRIEIHGFGPFGSVSIDLKSITGRIVAVTGDNGAGKSTLLELLAGALYRTCPTRGPLNKLATTRDARVEVDVVNGQSWRIRQMVDAHTGKGEALVLDESGQAVLSSAKLREYDQWSGAHLESPDVLYAGPFAVQGRRGFLDLSPAERKSVLLQVLDLAKYERMAEQAREKAREAKGAVDVARARLDDERRRTKDVAQAEAELEQAELEAEAASEQLRSARVALDRATAAAEDVARAREIAEQRRQAQQRLTSAQGQASDLEARIGNNRNLLGRGGEIREAEARAKELDEQLGTLREQIAANEQAHVAASDAYGAATDAAARARAATHQVEDRASRARKQLRDREAVELAEAEIEQRRAAVAELDTKLTDIGREREELSSSLLSNKDDRIAGLREGLHEISSPDSSSDPRAMAGDVLVEDDDLARAAEEAPQRIKEARQREDALRVMHREAQATLGETERLAARAGEMQTAQAELEAATADAERASAEQERAESNAVETGTRAKELASLDKGLRAEATRLRTERDALTPMLALLPRLDQAQARIEELEPQLEQARGRAAQVEAELAALPDVEAEEVDLTEYERAVGQAEKVERERRGSAALASKAVEDARAGAALLEQLAAELQGLEAELADWTRLGRDLGKDGLQAMEIDAAGPELNALTNDLLHTCHGSRFTVEVRTDRLAADGKRTIEGLDVRVLDGEQGRDALAETYSGGECVIVGEAIALALTMLACRRAGVENPTLVRDESGAALDPVNGRAYVAMLRRAAELIDADKVLFVSHDPSLQDLADARIEVRDGEVVA